ncbi:MAG: class I SAM-dependent methyltransferase [Candidatus Acidiferrales bacterium]
MHELRATSHEPRSTSPRILDVGCGPYKFSGAIGVDMNPATQADVLAHLDKGALPFADNTFDQLRAMHLIEHVEDVIKTMEDFHRVVRPGGTIYIVTPHYTDFSSFRDPTHRWHLNTYSFIYFCSGGLHGKDMWYTTVRMKERRCTVRLLKLWRALGFELLVNRARWFRQFWEHYLSFIIRGKVMEFEFEVIK